MEPVEAAAEPQAEDMESTGPQPDPLLAGLYGSDRPAVELVPGVALAPIVTACLPTGNPKDMLAESWIPNAPEDAGQGDGESGPPAFDPAAPEYNVLVKRLAKSAPFLEWNDLNAKQKQLEALVAKGGPEAEARQAELEACKNTLAEVEGQLSELKASFNDETISLVPWMQTLFNLADAGMTTFDVSGQFWPYCNLRSLFASKADTNPFDGVEKLLGTFKRRYERERGPNKIQILAKLAPNIFADGFGAASVEAAVERMRASVFGAEAVEPLDLLQLVWWDFQAYDVLPILKVLQKLATDTLEVSEGDSGADEVTVSEPKKIRGIGLVDFPTHVIKQAIQAGVPITSVQVTYSVVDRAAAPTLALCRTYGIKVLARGGTLGGLASEKYIGVPQPEPSVPDVDMDSVAGCLDHANNIGGWARLQSVLAVLKALADKHGVKVETVALRWLIDQGTFPIVSTRWGDACWRQFGYLHWREEAPGVDAQLFAKASFLDENDMQQLNGLHLLS